MKTEQQYNAYQEFTTQQDNEMTDLKQQLVKIEEDHKKSEESYKEAVKNGDESEANKQYELNVTLTNDIKSMKQRIQIKSDIMLATRDDKKKELLAHAKNLKSFYQDDYDKALDQLDKAVAKYNEAMAVLNQIDDEYKKESHMYQSILNGIEQSKKKELRRELGLSPNHWEIVMTASNPYTMHPNGKLEKRGN